MSVSFFGDYDTTETVVIPFNAFSSDDPSASITVTNLANTDVYIYKDGSLTQRTSSAGVAVDVDVDGIAGNHWVTIDLSDNTDAGFYVAGSRYQARMEGVTIDGATINAWIGAWSIGCTLRPTTAGRTLDVTATGAAGIDWGNVENKTTANDLSATDIQLCDTVTTNSDLVTAAAVVNEWESQSQADPTGFHVNVMEVDSQSASASSSITFGAYVGGAEAHDYANSGDAYAHLEANLGANGANATEAGGTGDHLTAVPKTGYSLANTGADLILKSSTFALAIADAVWDELMAGHTTADTSGLVMNELQNGGRLDLILDTIATDTTTDIPALIATAQADLDTITGTGGVLIGSDATLPANIITASALATDAVNEINATVDTALADIGLTEWESWATTVESKIDKVPKSDGTVSWNATALAAMNAQMDTALSDWGKTGFSLVSTGMDLVVLPADIITAASINTGAFTADAFAANALVAATFAASSLDGKGDWNTTVPDAAGTAATEVEVISAVSGLSTLTEAQVNAQCDAAIETYHLDHLFASNYDPASKPGVSTALLNELIEDDGGVSRYTANALEQASGTGATAEDVWTYATRVLTAGTNLNDLSPADVNAQVDAAIETYHLDHLLATAYDPASKPGAATALFNELIVSDAGVSQFSTNALENAPSGSTAVTITPIASTVDSGEVVAQHLTIYYGEEKTPTITVIDSDGDAIDCSAKTLTFICMGSDRDTKEFEVEDANISVAGSGNNECTVTIPETATLLEGDYTYALRAASTDTPAYQMLARGQMTFVQDMLPDES